MLVNINPYIGDNVYLVFCSKRRGAKKDIVIGCVIKRITIHYNEYKDIIIVEYLCESKKMITKGEKLENYLSNFYFTNATCDTGMKDFGYYPVFTTKEKCMNYLKGKIINN